MGKAVFVPLLSGLAAVVVIVLLGTALFARCTTGSATGQPAAGNPDWMTYRATVLGVRPSRDQRSVIIAVGLPAGRNGCARDPHTELVDEQPDMVLANVLFAQTGSARLSGCPATVGAEVTLTASEPLGGRQLTLNAAAWTPTAEGYHSCDATVGCHPPADHCAAVWIDKLMNTVAAEQWQGAERNVRGCDGRWLVLDVHPRTVGQTCPAAVGRLACPSPDRVTRWILRFEPTGWAEVTTTTGLAGCAGIVPRVAGFPATLCQDLPAVG